MTAGLFNRGRLLPLLVLALWCVDHFFALSQTLQPILVQGPSSNRFNIVFLSEGYTSTQLASFLSDATNAANVFLNRSPFWEYRTCFNIYAIPVASAQSGSDHPAWPAYRNTYFNSSYDLRADQLITLPPDTFDTNYSHGQGKVDALLQAWMPNCHLPILLVNDLVQGGSDGAARTAITYNGAGLADILIHEIGHVMGHLGDEYTNANPGFGSVEEPNTTRQTNASLIKWRAWIPGGVPLPTPATAQYDWVVGLFQGAHYHGTGWYRPKFDCTMNHPGTLAFCEVCKEALVLSLYSKMSLVNGYSPGLREVTITNSEPMIFSVVLNACSPGWQWFLNGVPLPGETNASFTLMPSGLSNGQHVLSAISTDATPLVRNDSARVLVRTNTWNVVLAIPFLSLNAPTFLSAREFTFRVNGYAPNSVVVQSSTNLVVWTSMITNNLTSGQLMVTDSACESQLRKFYRVLPQ